MLNNSLLAGILLFGSVSLPVSSQEDPFQACSYNFHNNTPPVVSDDLPGDRFAVCFDGFAVLYSGQSKTAIFSAEYLDASMLERSKSVERKDRFYEEARLPSKYRSKLSDYYKSGYDRGHLFPAGNASSDEIMAQSFSLANMVPQDPSHNRGPWANSVERAVRNYVERTKGAVYIITGPIYDSTPDTIGDSEVWVPASMYKFVYDPNKHHAWGYLLENNNSSRVEGIYSYEQMVEATGIEFLPKTGD